MKISAFFDDNYANLIRRLQEQTAKIKEKKALVIEDLAQVEPAVQDAKQGEHVLPDD